MAPDAIALEAGERRWSFAELDRAADRLAGRLRQAGAGQGTAVAVVLPAGAAAVVGVHAVPRCGAAVAPANARWSEPELAEHLETLRPAAILCRSDLRLPVEAADRGVVDGILDPSGRAGEPGRSLSVRVPAARPRADLADAHSVIWTSGTAGRARGVRLGLPGHLASARSVIRRLNLGPEDRWALSLSPAHVGGLALILRASVAGSRVVAVGDQFDAALLARLIDEDRVTHASIVPIMLRRLLQAREGRGRPPRRLRCLLVGGAPLAPDLLKRARKLGYPIAATYGLTETASGVATAPPELVERKPGTVGPPLDGTRIRIAADGEIRVKGPTLMLGWLGGEGRASGSGVWDEDGWLRTRDTGRLDGQGDLWVTGRSDATIVTGGVTVAPEPIEAILEAHPGIAEACVLGLPDEEWGERVGAAVVPVAPEILDRRALAEHLRTRLSGPRRPRAWVFLPAIPCNANGKPDRVALRRLLREAESREPEEESC
ncbi:MAG: class I adenylate-forming enzyme family protein [Gemmatimonadota bacterium]